MSVETLRAVNGIGSRARVPVGHTLLVPSQRPSTRGGGDARRRPCSRPCPPGRTFYYTRAARRHAAARRGALRRHRAATSSAGTGSRRTRSRRGRRCASRATWCRSPRPAGVEARGGNAAKRRGAAKRAAKRQRRRHVEADGGEARRSRRASRRQARDKPAARARRQLARLTVAREPHDALTSRAAAATAARQAASATDRPNRAPRELRCRDCGRQMKTGDA